MNYHVAIMNPELGFITKILNKEKTIETRWYKNKIAPWNRITIGDVVYFKNSGKLVTAKAIVSKVEQFSNLNPEKVKKLVNSNFFEIGLSSEIKDQFINKHIDKNYAILVWLIKPEKLEPIAIDKKGFGNAAAWLTTPRIESILRIENKHSKRSDLN